MGVGLKDALDYRLHWISKQSSLRLTALHALRVVHGDMKPDNVLLFEEEAGLIAKISDFGFCISGDNELKYARGATPLWIAPECMEGSSEQSGDSRLPGARDIYSYGLLIWYDIIYT